MNFEVILYAIIAIVLLARLWSVLGKRNDDEQQRPNPFVMPAPGPQEDKKAVLAGDPQGTGDPPPLYRSIRAAPASLAGALEQIKALDSSFDEKVFLQGARAAFTMIVEDFAKGDMSRITRLLGPKVLPHFQNALEERRKSGETMESHVTRIRDTETAAAQVQDSRAQITVRFVSEQENIVRDKQGQIVSGGPGKIEAITDTWTFARDTKSGDPNWILVETRS